MSDTTANGMLEGKRALITGAAGGIGSAAARAFAREGARVALVDLDESRLLELSGELASASGRPPEDFPALPGDVTDVAEVDRYMSEAVERLGGLDTLFNNAGVEGLVVGVQDYDDEMFDRVMRVNVRGVWLNLKRAVRFMLEGDGGSGGEHVVGRRPAGPAVHVRLRGEQARGARHEPQRGRGAGRPRHPRQRRSVPGRWARG